MKNFKLKIMAVTLLTLTGCYQKQETADETIKQPTIIEEETTIEIDPILEEDIETSLDSTASLIDENQLYLETGLSREEYETTPHLSLGELVTIYNENQIIGTVSFDKAEIITDTRGSGRKGLLLWFTETNTNTEPLEVGLYSMSPLTLITVFKENQQLKPLSTTLSTMGIENNEYLKNYHVEYENPNKVACHESTKLIPNESRTCYQLYSYAGEGDYLINQAMDQTYENWNSYLLTIKE